MVLSMLVLLLVMTQTIPATAFAQEVDQDTAQFSQEEILQLKPYVFVNEKGFFQLNVGQALKDGFFKELVKGRQNFFKVLNDKIRKGEMEARKDLEIVETTEKDRDELASEGEGQFSTVYSCPGKNTPFSYHWWGYGSYMDNCEANRFAI